MANKNTPKLQKKKIKQKRYTKNWTKLTSNRFVFCYVFGYKCYSWALAQLLQLQVGKLASWLDCLTLAQWQTTCKTQHYRNSFANENKTFTFNCVNFKTFLERFFTSRPVLHTPLQAAAPPVVLVVLAVTVFIYLFGVVFVASFNCQTQHQFVQKISSDKFFLLPLALLSINCFYFFFLPSIAFANMYVTLDCGCVCMQARVYVCVDVCVRTTMTH